MTIGTIKKLMAAYVGRDSVSDLVLNTVDAGLASLNIARLGIERMIDLEYSRVEADLSIASSGTLITAATVSAAAIKVKRVTDVNLPIASSQYRPVEFLTDREYSTRVQRQIGRTSYNIAATAASIGVSQVDPVAYQLGQTIYIAPAASFSFPVAAKVGVVKFLPDYTSDSDEDFLCLYAPAALQWAAILELNKFFRRYIPSQEGNISEESVKGYLQEEIQKLIMWNESIRTDTTTPPEVAAQPAQK